MRDPRLQGGEEGGARPGVQGPHRGHLGHSREQAVHAFQDLAQLGGGELRLAQGQIADLGLAAAPQVQLVVGLDRKRRQEGHDHQQEQALR